MGFVVGLITWELSARHLIIPFAVILLSSLMHLRMPRPKYIQRMV